MILFCFLIEHADQRKEQDDDERDEVFTVELIKGPHGLGLALVDGMVRI